MAMLVLTRRLRHVIMLCVVTALGACGGGSGGGDSSGGTTAAASGKVIKGLLANTTVTLRLLSNGEPGAPLDTTRTDSQGRFTLKVASGLEGPFLVEATTDATSRMRCDIPQGCGPANGDRGDTDKDGETDYGEWGPAPALTLSALASDRAMLAGLSITPFTHLAARYAATAPQGQDAVSAELTQSQTARALGLQTSLGRLAAFDIFSPPESATLEQWHYSLLCAAMGSLAGGDSPAVTLGAGIEDFATDFAADGGQFRLRGGNNGGLNIEALFGTALSLAQQLKPEAAALFSTRLADIAQAEDNDFTEATPDSGAGQETLAKVDGFLADWRQWREEFPLPGNGVPLATARAEAFQPDLDAHWVLVRSLAAISPLAPQTTQPELLLGSACSALTNVIYRAICNRLASSPRNLCLLNLSVNGQTLCNYLNNVRLPTTEGLVAEANVFDRTATLGGAIDGWEIDLQFSPGSNDDKNIQMSFAGTISGENHLWAITDGVITFGYADVITATNIRQPATVKADFKLDHSAESAAGLVSGQFTSKITLDALALNAIGTPDYVTALPAFSLDLVTTGRFTTPLAGDASLSLKGGNAAQIRISQPLMVTSTGLASSITLSGAPSRWQTGLLDAEAQWSDGRLTAAYSDSGLDLRGDGDMRAVLPESPDRGSLYLGDRRVGVLTRLGAGWQVKRPDFTEESL